MALQLALITKVNTAGPDVFLISPEGLGDVSNRAVAVLFDMAQDLISKPLPIKTMDLQVRLDVARRLVKSLAALAVSDPLRRQRWVPTSPGGQHADR